MDSPILDLPTIGLSSAAQTFLLSRICSFRCRCRCKCSYKCRCSGNSTMRRRWYQVMPACTNKRASFPARRELAVADLAMYTVCQRPSSNTRPPWLLPRSKLLMKRGNGPAMLAGLQASHQQISRDQVFSLFHQRRVAREYTIDPVPPFTVARLILLSPDKRGPNRMMDVVRRLYMVAASDYRIEPCVRKFDTSLQAGPELPQGPDRLVTVSPRMEIHGTRLSQANRHQMVKPFRRFHPPVGRVHQIPWRARPQ